MASVVPWGGGGGGEAKKHATFFAKVTFKFLNVFYLEWSIQRPSRSQ